MRSQKTLAANLIRLLLVLAAFLFAYAVMGVFLFGQLTPNWPMPPDLLNAKPSCELLEYESGEVFDAKTKQVEQLTRVLVLPVATYADHRPRWTLPEETLPTNKDIKHIGAIADVANGHDAWDVCHAWMAAVKTRTKDLKQQNQKEKHE